MKNKKGFTLTELLAVIVILAIIVAIAAPNMTKQIKKQETEEQNILNQKIENAAHLYAAKYYANAIVNCSSGECASFTLNDLEQDGLLRLKDSECSSVRDEYIFLKNNSGSIQYDYRNIATSCYRCPDNVDSRGNYCN